MDETKEQLKLLIDYFTGPFLSRKLSDDSNESDTNNSHDLNEDKKSFSIVRKDINLIINTLELCKNNFTHFTNSEKSYLLPLMTLCGHLLLTETHLIPRTSLATVSDILVYILQFLLSELSTFSDEDVNVNELNTFISNISLDCQEYYRYLLKYRITKFLNFLLINDESKYSKQFFTDKELVKFCQMLFQKSMPDTLRCHSPTSTSTISTPLSTDIDASSGNKSTTIPSNTSSAKRIRLTQPSSSDRNSKEEFFDQLLTPFIVSSNIPVTNNAANASRYATHSLHSVNPFMEFEDVKSPSSNFTPSSVASNKSQSIQIRSYLISHNQMYFQYAGGANILLNLINSYTMLRSYILHLLAIEEGAPLRFIKIDMKHFESICDRIASDIDLISTIFELNRLLEPLSCDRISKMIVTVQACLYACLTLISSVNNEQSSELTSGDPDKIEHQLSDIVIQSLDLYTKLFEIFRHSNRVAGQICQNAHMFTSWLLLSGLQLIQQANRQSANNTKHKGYSGLCNPLAMHALKMMGSLLDDLHLEFGDQNATLDDSDENSSESLPKLSFLKKFSFTSGPTQSASQQLSPSASQTGLVSGGSQTLSSSTQGASNGNVRATFKYNKFGHYSAWQRIEMIVSSNLNIIQLLFSYLSTGYRRACLLRSFFNMNNDDQSTDDSNKLAENKLFAQFLDSKENDDNIYSKLLETYSRDVSLEDVSRISPAQIERHLFIDQDAESHYDLVIAILDHLNYYFICSKIDALQSFFKQMLSDAQLIVLAHIIQDLDFEFENSSLRFLPFLSKTFYKFSSSLTSLMHNLIAMQILSEEQQNSLMAYLGFKPSADSQSSWKLYHGTRSLAILAQIILLRQQKEEEDIKLDLNSITIQIWRGFINQLKSSSLKFKGDLLGPNNECPVYYEDLNVEHAQLMLFLFHNLKLLQRKHVFYLVGMALHEISSELNSTPKRTVSAAQILFIGRLLHFFEYMCKNLYDTPAYLFKQINHNLLNRTVNRNVSANDNVDDKFEVEDSIQLDKSFESLRRILFFVDKRLEMNYFSYAFSQKDSNNFSNPLTLSMNALSSVASIFETDNEDKSESVNAGMHLRELIIHPRFYHLMDISYLYTRNSSSHASLIPKLDGMACNFMLAGFPSLAYDQFYNSLLNLFQFLGNQYDVDMKNPSESTSPTDSGIRPARLPQLGPFGLCCLDYSFQTMWRLINQLPPTIQSFTEIIGKVENYKTLNYDTKLDSARIINMCVWIPRLENRAVYTWIRELLAKANNSQLLSSQSNDSDESSTTSKASSNLDEILRELLSKFNSLQFNYRLFKAIIQSYFRLEISNSKLSSAINSHVGENESSLWNVQFPKLFTLISMDLFIERVMGLIKQEFFLNSNSTNKSKSSSDSKMNIHPKNDVLTNSNSKNLPPTSQKLIYEKFLPQMIGLFYKMYNDINVTLIYDGSLSKNRSPANDLKYHFNRALVNICSTNCFDSSLSDISANIVDFLPHTILLKIDQWNRIYANLERSPNEIQLNDLLVNGAPIELPLVEVQPSLESVINSLSLMGNNKSSNPSPSATYLNNFSSFLNEKLSLYDFPVVNSIDTGVGNISWIKLKQVWFKLFKFSETIYSTKNFYQHTDPFVVQLLSMQLNLVSNSLTHCITESSNSTSYQILFKAFDLIPESNELYCSSLYPQFIRNAFFILTIFKNGSFNELSNEDQLKFQNVHEDCSNELFLFFSKILKKPSGKVAFEEFLCDTTPTTPTISNATMAEIQTDSFSFLDLIQVAAHPKSTWVYGMNLLKLIKTLLSQADKNPDDISIIRLCSGLSSSLAERSDRVDLLFNWFYMVLFHRKYEKNIEASIEMKSSKNKIQSAIVDEVSNNEIYLLYKFVCYVIKDTSRFDEIVLASIAEALIPNARNLLFSSGNFLSFSGIFVCLVFLMSSAGNSDQFIQTFGKTSGHLKLIDEVVSWLSLAKEYLSKKEVIRKIEDNVTCGRHQFILESSYQLLSYLSDIFNALEYKFVHLRSRKPLTDNEDDKSSKLSLSLSSLGRIFIDDDLNYDDDHMGDGGGSDIDDDDDEDEELCERLCTFTTTQKEFINQHWYHCHTCKMLDGVGVCNVCAQVCHRGHDVTYSKHGSFFCDCGANEDGTCKALVKRQPAKQSSIKDKSNRQTKRSSQSKPSGNKSSSLYDKKKLMRISRYWYNSLYTSGGEFNQWKLSDNYKMSRNKFSNTIITENYERFGLKYEHFENFINLLMTYISPVSETVLNMIEFFVPTLEDFFYQHSELGYLSNIRKEFATLHNASSTNSSTLSMEKCEQIVSPIKCSQEPLFENVQNSPDQAQSIRNLSLITCAIVRRSSMIVLGASSSFNASSANVNPCLLLIVHDKNRISVVQLNLLLNQIYSGSRKKLSPKRLAAITFPFTVMTMAHNPMNDELIAVCGLKDCHVLSLARSGSVTGHYSLFMALDKNNYIIKAIWLPNSQTELAIVTIDFIKIYDLSREDRDSSVYNFLIPGEKIRDMTFFSCEENGQYKRFALIFSSHGQIFVQELNSDSMCYEADQFFYLSSFLNVDFPESWSPEKVVSFSIYYSHLLQMLFVSYLSGKSFCVPFSINNISRKSITNVTSLEMNPSRAVQSNGDTGSSDSSSSKSFIDQPPLFHWTEVLTHPGLIFTLTMNSNYPICFMVKSNTIQVQELKLKKKVIDFVALSSSPTSVIDSNMSLGNKITTMIALCDDGSLRFYNACNEQTKFWLRPNFLSLEAPFHGLSYGKSKSSSSGNSSKIVANQSSVDSGNSNTVSSSTRQPRFPIDFFENCTFMNDVEFGGSDILEVYNTKQIKNRLNSASMYIACTKPNGFTMTVTQTGANDSVMAGIRVHLGVCDPARSPTAIEVFGRSKLVAINRQRWFDIPFTRSEIAQLAETKTFNIRFAPSGDVNNVTIVDCIKVYGRKRDSIGLYADEEPLYNSASEPNASTSNNQQHQSSSQNQQPSSSSSQQPTNEDVFSEPFNRSATSHHGTSYSSKSSSFNKHRLLLYSPTITDDEFVSNTTTNHKGIVVLNRLIANCLDVLESSFSFFKSLSEQSSTGPNAFSGDSNAVMVNAARDLTHSSEYQLKCDTALSIGSKLLTISLNNRLDRSVCMLLAKLLNSRMSYDEHRDEVIFENSIDNMKKRAFDDIIVFYYNLSLFRVMVIERPRNFVRLISKFFTQGTDLAASSIQFNTYLSELFWRLYQQRPINELLAPIVKVSLSINLESIVDSLVYLFYSSMLASLSIHSDGSILNESQNAHIRKTATLITQLLCSSDPQISYSTKKALSRILTINVASSTIKNMDKSKTSGKAPSTVVKAPSTRERHSASRQSDSSGTRRRSTTSNNEESVAGQLLRYAATFQNRIRQLESGSSSNSSDAPFMHNLFNSAAALPNNSNIAEHSSSLNRQDNVLESLEGEFDAYRNLLLNVPMLGDDFDDDVYLNDLISLNIATDQSVREEDDEDDDDDDDDDLNMAINVQSNSSVPPPPPQPLFPLIDAFAPVNNGEPGAPNDNGNLNLLEAEEDANAEDDEDDDDDEEEEEDEEDFEAMDEAEDAMMELAIALSLQDSQQNDQELPPDQAGSGALARSNASASLQALRYLHEFNNFASGDENTPPRRQPRVPHRQAPRPSSQQLNQSSSSGVGSSSQSQSSASTAPPPLPPHPTASSMPQQQQADYVMLHSESDEDEEELFDDEMKIENIEFETTRSDDEDDDELNSLDTSVCSAPSSSSLCVSHKTRPFSKSNETLTTHKSNHSHPSLADHGKSPKSDVGSSTKTGTCMRHKKRIRKLITSKFCVALLKQMSNSVDMIVKLDGVQSIPYLQVLIMLADFKYLEADQKEFCNVFSQMIVNLLGQLLLDSNVDETIESSTPIATISSNASSKRKPIQFRSRIERADQNEVFLLIMRLFSVFISRSKHFPTLHLPTYLNKDFNLIQLAGTQSLSPQPSQATANLESTLNQQQPSTASSTSPTSSPSVSSSCLGKAVTFDEQSIRSSSSSLAIASTSTSTPLIKEKLNQSSYSLLLTASQLVNSNGELLNYCLSLLQHLLRNHWRPLNATEIDSEKNKAAAHGETIVYHSKKPISIRPHLNFIPYDLKPFFMIIPQNYLNSTSSSGSPTSSSQQSATNEPTSSGANVSNTSDPCTMLSSVIFSNNVFDRYSELLTEMCLRLPYQMKKLNNTWNTQSANCGSDAKNASMFVDFDPLWIEILCEYMMLPSVTPYIRKQVRKLLAYLCGSKERYRQVRDYYSIKTHLRAVRRIIVKHFFDSNSSTYALKLEDLDLTEEDLEDEEQLDELIEVIVSRTFLQNDDQTGLMMSTDQHRLLNLPYSQLISLVDYLKACLEISNSRVLNWQRLCQRELRILPFLFRVSLLFGEGVSSIILHLISLALFINTTDSSKSISTLTEPSNNSSLNNFILTESKIQNEESSSKSSLPAEQKNSALCRYVFTVLDRSLLSQFIRYFLLESNSTQYRWAAHSLLYHFYQSLQPRQQEQLLAMFWQLWPNLACYGKRASQFVDLLGYFTLNSTRSNNDLSSPRIMELERNYAESAIGLLKHQNSELSKHPNANIYNSLQSLLEFNGYYLETEPCLVCNNPEVNFVPVKLSSIKMDSRFTTNTHIVKMIGSHTISKISVKISELKKTKMVKTLSIYYNNRCVQSVVELKNRTTTWHKAKRVNLQPAQTEVKIDFALPIVACNIMIEYSNFYESSHSSTETLQCPRCSSIVAANPGVCTNCGENVSQCHKCRAINYDEKDPFLCNSCGFCKYAKFDYILTARYNATAVETIENEEDRSKAVQTINTLLDKADRLYKLILAIRPNLEQLLLCSQDYISTVYCTNIDGESTAPVVPALTGINANNGSQNSSSNGMLSSSSSSFHVNRYIQSLASRYCIDCRMHFEELSKIVQKVLYTRKELVDYDNRQNGNRYNYGDLKKILQERRTENREMMKSLSSNNLLSTSTALAECCKKRSRLSPEIEWTVTKEFKTGHCYGCASATIEHCITLLKAMAYTPRFKSIFNSCGLFRDLIDYNLRLGPGNTRSEVRSLLCLLTRDNLEATEEFNNLLLNKIKSAFQSHHMTSFDFGSIRHEMALLAASFDNEDIFWEQRLRCVMKLFLLSLKNKSPSILETITLPCLRILYGLIVKPSKTDHGKPITDKSPSETIQQMASVQSGSIVNKPLTPITFDSLMVNVTVDLSQWLSGDVKNSFSAWQLRNQKLMSPSECMSDPEKMEQLTEHLQRKYFHRWLYLYRNGRLGSIKSESFAIRIASSNWIREVLFNPTSKALRIACRQLLMALFERLTNKQLVIIDLLTSFLDDLCEVGGETGLEFYDLYRSIIFSEFIPQSKGTTTNTNLLAMNRHWRYYLTLRGLLQHLGQLISAEIARLKQLEDATLSSGFSQGFALRQLVELLQMFMCDDRIRRVHKSSMVAFVLDGYLSLRMLIVQRTKMVDDTQGALLELLELLTTGTKAETINFMKVCIESVNKCSLQDLRTPVFIFERLCSIIHPEEKDADEFFISLDKDPQQEDFLQGRMLGNPYSSKDVGMGPLMRDIKNKICQECELVSLLEDDSGLELLVNNKIISLDLPVKEVYKKIVCAEHQAAAATASSDGGRTISGVSNSSWASIAASHLNLNSDIIIDPLSVNMFSVGGSLASGSGGASSGSTKNNSGPTMKIIYRIRGLMGDATEEFIETFNNKESVVEDDEKQFELANIMSTQTNGLHLMLERLQTIDEINNRSRQLLFVLLKLFSFSVRVVSNRRALISPDLNAIGTMLRIARLFLNTQQPDLLINPSEPGKPSYFEILLGLMETILAEASRENAESYDIFNQKTCGTSDDIRALINAVTSFDSIVFNATATSTTSKILRIATFLALGNTEKLNTLLSFFKPYFDFDSYDRVGLLLEDAEHRIELLCSLVSGIETNDNGARIKDHLIDDGSVPCTIEYLVRHAPPMKNFLLINSDEWKEFTSRPALKYVLRILTGLSHGHENTQLLMTRDAIPIIHGLEQVLTDSHMATLAENLMDAIKENPSVEAKIQEVRLRTREEKKRIAMAVREKQLGELGMKANDKGQVMADSHLLKQMEEQLGEEKGLVCSICREGYAYQSQKVLAIYTFTKRCNVDEHEDRKPRRTVGYTTVTHFNIIHVECHMSAVRHARTRDEWQSAALHNANTRCNGLLPMWGPQVFESLFAHALARHNSYLQDAVGQRDFAGSNSFMGTVHDLKLLLLRFATESSFSEETGGGGAQSNLYLTPYLIHIALYVINTTKLVERERSNLDTKFIQLPADKWIENCFQADSPYLWTLMMLLLRPHRSWTSNRNYCLRRLIFCEHVRHLPAESRNGPALAAIDPTEIPFARIKPALMFFGMINLFYTVMFKNVVSIDPENDWPISLANFIRHNDQSILESADKMLDTFENDLLLSSSFGEFCDAIDLLRGSDAIDDPDQFLNNSFKLPE